MRESGPAGWTGRLAWLALAGALGTAAGLLLAAHGEGWWQLAAFGAGPDLALLGGMAQGRLHPRAVPVYNALHRPAGPAALLAVAVAADLGPGWAVAALASALHIAIDRAAGYGLRAPDGLRRA